MATPSIQQDRFLTNPARRETSIQQDLHNHQSSYARLAGLMFLVLLVLYLCKCICATDDSDYAALDTVDIDLHLFMHCDFRKHISCNLRLKRSIPVVQGVCTGLTGLLINKVK